MSRAASILFEIVSAVAAFRIMSQYPTSNCCSKLVQHVIDIDLLIGVETVEDCAINYLSVLGEAHPEGGRRICNVVTECCLNEMGRLAVGQQVSQTQCEYENSQFNKILLRRNFQAFIYRYKMV